MPHRLRHRASAILAAALVALAVRPRRPVPSAMLPVVVMAYVVLAWAGRISRPFGAGAQCGWSGHAR
ncbi:MAG: hypothetical protein ACREQ5_08600, partial [Candidatus Dormibacteria bacterium]